MKQPDRDYCPCCGCGLLIRPNGAGDNVTPRAHFVVDDPKGFTVKFNLFWRCRVCGLQWRDGQAFDTDGKAIQKEVNP